MKWHVFCASRCRFVREIYVHRKGDREPSYVMITRIVTIRVANMKGDKAYSSDYLIAIGFTGDCYIREDDTPEHMPWLDYSRSRVFEIAIVKCERALAI